MFFGCVVLLTAGFMAEVPPAIEARLNSTNETAGTFVQTKTMPDGKKWVSRGTYRIRPGKDFEWAVHEPFETCFFATPSDYVYTNEDERVERELKDLPYFSRLNKVASGDYTMFFDAFDALYKEEGGRFFMKAKPKAKELKRFLERVDAEGDFVGAKEWELTATFPDGTTFKIELKEDGR